MGVGGGNIWYFCINPKSAGRTKKFGRCEIAADLVHFSSSAIRATALQCCIQLCSVKGAGPRARPGQRSSDTCAYKSQLRCQRGNQHASSGSPPTSLQNNIICQHRQYIPANTLTSDCTVTAVLHFWPCPIQVGGGNRFLKGHHIRLMNPATWYCLIECAKSKLDSLSQLLPSLPRQELMKDNRLCINQRDGALCSHSLLD